jgi:hypothetical protein
MTDHEQAQPCMTTLTQLRARLLPGTQVLQVWNGREDSVRHVLTVTARVQTRKVETTCPDFQEPYWISFPNRRAIEFTGRGWIRWNGDRKMAEYEWLPPATEGEGGQTA